VAVEGGQRQVDRRQISKVNLATWNIWPTKNWNMRFSSTYFPHFVAKIVLTMRVNFKNLKCTTLMFSLSENIFQSELAHSVFCDRQPAFHAWVRGCLSSLNRRTSFLSTFQTFSSRYIDGFHGSLQSIPLREISAGRNIFTARYFF